MADIHPENSTRRIAVRIAAAVGLPAAAVAAVLAVPTAAQADPSLEDQIDTVESQYDDVAADLSDLIGERAELHAQLAAVDGDVSSAPQALEAATLSVDVGDSAVDRLGALTGHSHTEIIALDDAVQTGQAGAQRLEVLDVEIAELQSDLDDLVEQREELEDELEAELEAEAEEPAESDSDAASSSDSDADASGGSGSAAVVDFAHAQLGDPYVFGAAGPDSWDCSGLTQQAWAAAGESIGRDVAAQWNGMSEVSRDELQPGDLVMYSGQSHVGVYIGDDEVIHAPTPGDVVKTSSIDMMPVDGYRTV